MYYGSGTVGRVASRQLVDARRTMRVHSPDGHPNDNISSDVESVTDPKRKYHYYYCYT